MGSFSFGEILTILVIILIIFGPNRLPEFARKVGELIAWSRKSLREFTESIEGEVGDGMQPLADLKREFDGARNDLTGAINSISTGATTQPRTPADPQDDAPDDGTSAAAESDGDGTEGDAELERETSAPVDGADPSPTPDESSRPDEPTSDDNA